MTETLSNQDLWYKDAIIYQLHVKTFADGNGDGIGDFKGLIDKIDYLSELGVNTLWLLPFYPSPLKDDGYDTADYMNINPSYGTIKDFKNFLKKAHEKDMKVITELVVNHTSDQHEWFQKSRVAKKGSVMRDFYMWSDKPDKYLEARIIFKDFETSNWAWDPVAKAYYWHRFYSHQPDLNYDSEHVHKAIFKIADFWFNMGVDGVRLDAIPYLYAREGTSCENLPETHEFLKKLRAYVDTNHKGKMLLAEANQWPEDSVQYFGHGDECNMSFHFPLMPRMYMAVQMEDKFPISDILEQTPDIPENCQWALFLRNHDELTLEMVTDEERDYMYRVYASDRKARINLGIRRRLAPLLNNNRKKIELMNCLLFSMPGSPILYYGDEIGMGDNYYLGDRNGVRTPMQWSCDRNAGFSNASPQELYLPVIIEPEYHYQSINVENQEKNDSSLLNWTRKLIDTRKKYKAFGRGNIEFLNTGNNKVICYKREFEDESVLIIANLSSQPQFVEINLSDYEGYYLKEIFSKNKFPIIKKDTLYPITLGEYGFYWFEIKKKKVSVISENRTFDFNLNSDNWRNASESVKETLLETKVLSEYLKSCNWFKPKDKEINQIKIKDNVLLFDKPSTYLIIFDVSFNVGNPETYLILGSLFEGVTDKITREDIIAIIKGKQGSEILYDSFSSMEVRNKLLKLISTKSIIKAKNGNINFFADNALKNFLKTNSQNSVLLNSKHNNTIIDYNQSMIFKFYRKNESGNNPELEIINYLNDKDYRNAPEIVGGINYESNYNLYNIGVVQRYINHEGDLWHYTLDSVNKFFNEVNIRHDVLDINHPESYELIENMIGVFYLDIIKKAGKRSAEMHILLNSEYNKPEFRPETFSFMYQRSIYQSARNKIKRAVEKLKKYDGNDDLKDKIIKAEGPLLEHFKQILNRRIRGNKSRVHGDFNLKQFLFTGKDLVIIDFEGDVAKPFSERSLKRTQLRDIASLLRSFSYAIYIKLSEKSNEKEFNKYSEYADIWYKVVIQNYLNSYMDNISEKEIITNDLNDFNLLLQISLADRLFSSLGHELENNNGNPYIPIRSISLFLENI